MSTHSPTHERPTEERPPASAAVTLRYHELTKHSYYSVRRETYSLDWANQPSPYKRYLKSERQPLPKGSLAGLPPTLELLRSLNEPNGPVRGPASLTELSALCHLGYGITAQKFYPSLIYELRAAPSAGALFPSELYLCLRGVEGLPDGVYHYASDDHSLSRLRSGDFLPHLRKAAGHHPTLAGADLIFIISAIWWRSSWKYRDRAYRYCLHDAGHLAGNLLLAAKGLGYRPAVVYDFVDEEVSRLLGLDGQREAPLVLVSCCLGRSAPAPSAAPQPLPPIAPAYQPLSARETTYPLISEAHNATCLPDMEALRATRSREPGPPTLFAEREELPSFPLPDPAAVHSPQPLSETIARRRSSRGFAHQPISIEALSRLLAAAVAGHPSDQAVSRSLDVALIVNAVEGVEPGVYHYDAIGHQLLRVRGGNFRAWAAYLSLEQQMCGDAAAVLFFLADLERLTAGGGERAYRRAHIEAGLRGEWVYLAGRALGLGCSGIGAFYDDQVDEFLEAPPGANVIYGLAVGMEVPDERVVERNL